MNPFLVPAAQDARSCSGVNQVEVLGLVCTVVSDARTMCAALCTSSSAREAILATCRGGLQLQLKPEVHNPDDITDTDALEAVRHLREQAAWLGQYGGLVGELQLQSAAGMQCVDEMAWSLRPPLQLRCLQLDVYRPVPLLKQLAPSRLTRLELVSGILPLLPAALSRLTGLKQLAVAGSWSPLHASMAATLAGMPQLTQLVLQPQLPAAALAQLPSQLVELQLSNPECTAAQLAAHMQALQQLQRLTLLYCTGGRDFAPASHAAVWAAMPQLKQLGFESCWGIDLHLMADLATGIAGATSLTRLYGVFTTSSVDLVAVLSPLKRLHSLELHLEREVPQSFGLLLSRNLTQLKSLALEITTLPSLAVAQVCLQATQLTELMLSCNALTDEHVAMIAESMEGLQRLAVAGGGGFTSDGLVSALAAPKLPRLEQLATWDNYQSTDEQRAGVVEVLAQARPSVKVACEECRVCIPRGFVGALCYPGF